MTPLQLGKAEKKSEFHIKSEEAPKMHLDDDLTPLCGVQARRRPSRAIYLTIGVCCLAAVMALAVVLSSSSSSRRSVLEDKGEECTEELLEVGGCHVDGNEQFKDEDVNERWATADWMNGYNDVTEADVTSDEYQPWVDKLNQELGGPEDSIVLPAPAIIPPVLPPTVKLLSGTTVVVTTCEPLWGCQQNRACLDRWDWLGPYGGCQAYTDWNRRMGWCENDIDVYGVPASVACPVSCDTCPWGKCYDPYSKEITACAGGITG